jgi:hypothetical protein
MWLSVILAPDASREASRTRPYVTLKTVRGLSFRLF